MGRPFSLTTVKRWTRVLRAVIGRLLIQLMQSCRQCNSKTSWEAKRNFFRGALWIEYRPVLMTKQFKSGSTERLSTLRTRRIYTQTNMLWTLSIRWELNDLYFQIRNTMSISCCRINCKIVILNFAIVSKPQRNMCTNSKRTIMNRMLTRMTYMMNRWQSMICKTLTVLSLLFWRKTRCSWRTGVPWSLLLVSFPATSTPTPHSLD